MNFENDKLDVLLKAMKVLETPINTKAVVDDHHIAMGNRHEPVVQCRIDQSKATLENSEIVGSSASKASGKKLHGREFAFVPDPLSLFSLSRSLRNTVIALYGVEKATAEELSRETKMSMTEENASVSLLVKLGAVKKKTERQNTYYYIETQQETEERSNHS